MIPCNYPVYCVEPDHVHEGSIKFSDVDSFTPTHRVNLFEPRFHFHYARNEWYAIIMLKPRGWTELIVRTSHGVPYDSYYRLRKVMSYVEPVLSN